MTIQSNGRVLVLAKNTRLGSDNKTYYNLAIMIGGEAGNISCVESVYNDAIVGVENGVIYAYNDQYRSFRVIDIVPESSVPDGRTDGVPDGKKDGKQVAK